MLSCFDLDHTLLRKNSSVEFCRYLYKKKVFSSFDVFYCLISYLNHRYFGLSLEKFHEKIFSKILKGFSLGFLEELVSSFLDSFLESLLYPPVFIALQAAQKRGEVTFVLSSGPDFLVRPIAKRLDVSVCKASEYLVDKDGCLCKIAMILHGEGKALAVRAFQEEWGIPKQAVTVYSDSILDLPFLQAAGVPIAVRPDRKLRKIAQNLRWKRI